MVRLSGPACRAAVAAFLGRQDPKPRHYYHGDFKDPVTGEILDDPAFVFLAGPASSTGEDMLEIFLHGNLLLVERILAALLAFPGVRLAEPGEFTRRALENGKIDLLQAEAVGGLIHAETLAALRNARRIAEGGLAGPIRSLRDALVDLSVRLELEVDFAEEEADPDFASWLPKVDALGEALQSLARGFERNRALSRAPRVVVLGAPNAGKSSLVNALVEEERLLVSDVAGTTRDYVEVPLRLSGGLVHLVDTAGLGPAADALDAAAQERTRVQGIRADLRLWVEDGTLEPGAPPVGEGPLLRVRTRRDLPGFRNIKDTLPVSCQTREGLGDLLEALGAQVFREEGAAGEDARLMTERQARAVAEAWERMAAARDHLTGRPAVELVAFEVREAARCLRDLLGEIPADEVLRKVFAGFCIGK